MTKFCCVALKINKNHMFLYVSTVSHPLLNNIIKIIKSIVFSRPVIENRNLYETEKTILKWTKGLLISLWYQIYSSNQFYLSSLDIFPPVVLERLTFNLLTRPLPHSCWYPPPVPFLHPFHPAPSLLPPRFPLSFSMPETVFGTIDVFDLTQSKRLLSETLLSVAASTPDQNQLVGTTDPKL